MTASSRSAFEELLEYVETDLAFATSHYNDAYLDRRVSARMRRTHTETYEEYLDLLEGNDDEAAALLDAFSINVTSFFRNPSMWEELRTILRTLSRRTGQIQLWSAACSDGREPYSLAMLAMDDPAVEHTRVSITATDISDRAIELARAGKYRSTRTTDIADELSLLEAPDEFVRRDRDRFIVRPKVKRLVTFRRHDLIRDEPLGTFDLVMCRNLFIYIDPAFKESLFSTIDRSLSPGDFLVIGMAETLPAGYRPVFESVTDRCRILRRLD